MTLEQWILVGQLAAVVAALLAIAAALAVGKKDREAADDRAAEDRRIADKRSSDDRREADARAQTTHEKADARAAADRSAARELREEQAQPYVMARLESDREDPGFIDLVLRNYGTTAAMQVEIEITPQPTLKTNNEDEAATLPVPAVIPTLVPGQEWRTFWRSSYETPGAEQADRYEARITFTDSRSASLSTLSVLDFATHTGRMYLQRYGLNDIAKTLRKIEKRDERRATAERMQRTRSDLPPAASHDPATDE